MSYDVVGLAGNEIDAKKTEELNPDLVLLNISLKGDLYGLETAQQIQDISTTLLTFIIFI